ncbi:hypothetical protein F8388_023951 [Cannabis sativa]|uniref:Tyrosinase copper-binding domain-containing protein n=1 Tax=Cannabis sativa TaxID=3483 RepID=A0A7J6EWN6_CANSA|nr:hypothetical protein F8388_023951 [Cannabis sativa]
MDDPTFALPFWNWDSPPGMECRRFIRKSILASLRHAPGPFSTSHLHYWAGDEAEPGPGSYLESLPHGPINLWTGESTQPNFENMGDFYFAARDPIFFFHHSNIDRLLSVWETLGGSRTVFTDPDWLDTDILFYNEYALLVRVKVRDCLDTRKLGMRIEKLPCGPEISEFAGSFVNVPHKQMDGKKTKTTCVRSE